ncbi:MAG: FAD-dependent oxidoreductase [Tannerella sp.]|jgi:hypothetical protein|nr:FAD-dependent oxidoreductase [Tannerella sp.]
MKRLLLSLLISGMVATALCQNNRHVMIVCADPQVAFKEELPLLEKATRDMKALVAESYPDIPVYGIVCGDIISDIQNDSLAFSDVKKLFDLTGIPFHYLAGNHDMDITERSNDNSKKSFEENFGPSHYSFNIGKVHYVVLDDVFSTGRAYSYIGYIDEKQFRWLEQDLSSVPHGSTVMVALHIPTYSREARKGEYAKEEINKAVQNRRALYKMLEPYRVHILSGHEHYNENYVLNDRLFEHVHAALCGIFWQAPYNSDGAPLGYAVYEYNGDSVQWYYKVAGKDKNFQMNVYAAGADRQQPNAIIANVWNYDPAWQVCWYEDGKKMGEMKQYTGWDPATVDYVEKNRQNFRYKYVGAGATEHLFYAEPVNKNAEIRVEAVDRFGNKYTEKPHGPASLLAGQDRKELETDVLVIGGTTGGTSAGIAAARQGVKTLIVEETPWLGGMFTAQGVGACDGNNNLPSGIWNEFREKLRVRYGGTGGVWTGWVSNTLFEPHVGDSIFKAMAAEEKHLSVIYGYFLDSMLKEENTVRGAVFLNDRGEKLTVKAKITVDATDLGESLKMSGTDYRLGMDSKSETGETGAVEQANNIVQDLTWVAILKDYGEGADKTIPHPANCHPASFAGCCEETTDKVKIDCQRMMDYGKMPNHKYMINWPTFGNDIYLNVVELSREERNRELQKAKEQTLSFVYYIQHELGFKHLGLADDEFDTPDLLAYKPYHREGRRVKGIAFLTFNHVANPYGQKDLLYRTGISVGDYPVDHHHAKNPEAPKIGFEPVPSFNVPLGALIPQKTDGLIVADKAISVSNMINGATRLQPVVLLTGQAAGILAALSVKEDRQPRYISVRKVQDKLLKEKAYIMPLYDIQPEDPDFEAIQKITATGILQTTGEPFGWANRTWFYPDSTLSVEEFTKGLHSFDKKMKIMKSSKILTEKEAVVGITKAKNPRQIFPADDYKDIPVTRRRLAVLLDSMLNPFSRETGFDGHYK